MKLKIMAVLGIYCFLSCNKTETPPSPTPNQPKLSVSGFSPVSGKTGDTITITGTNFGSDLAVVRVTFGSSTKINPLTVTDIKLTVKVPNDATSGKISVSVNSNSASSTNDFILLNQEKPTITSFAPATATIGDTIIITGTGYSTDTNAIAIQFGMSASVKPIAASTTSLRVIIPSDAKTGKIQVSVSTLSVTSVTDLTVKPPLPVITDFFPKTVSQGDTLKITGKNFGTDINNVFVVFNGSYKKALTVSPTEITVIIPLANPAKKEQIIVSITGVGDAKSIDMLTNLPPTSTHNINPNSARPGEIVTFNGLSFINDYPKIKIRFYGSSEDVKPITTGPLKDNYFLVRVPLDAKTGPVKITLDGYGTGSAGTMTILPALPQIQTGTWTERPDLPLSNLSGRDGAIAFTVNNKAYVGLGTTHAPFDSYANSDLWEYDPMFESWMQVASHPGNGRVHAAAFSIGNKGYVVTGKDNNSNRTKDLWEYDPATNSWKQKADIPGDARYYATAFADGVFGYVGVGNVANTSVNGGTTNDFYQYTPSSNSWKQIASLPYQTVNPFSFAVNGKGYVGGGWLGSSTPLSQLYMYDLASNNWIAKTGIPGYSYTGGNASFVIGSKAYVGLGYKRNNTNVNEGSTSFFEYSPSTDSWTSMPNFAGQKRHFAVGFTLNNIGYFGLGAQDGNLAVYKNFWAYKP